MLAARKVRQRAMQRLVRQDEFGLLEGQRLDVAAIVIKRARIGGGGAAPFGVGLHERQAQHQRAEERLVDNQPGSRGDELIFDLVMFRHKKLDRIYRNKESFN